MSLQKQINTHIKEKLEHRIIHGLACEWEKSLWVLSPEHRELMRKPLFALRDMKHRLGYWCGVKREISLSREFVLNYSWDAIYEVLLHEIAHQFAEEVLKSSDKSAHGPKFQKACFLLRANPRASGTYKPLNEMIHSETTNSEDKIMLRIKKLMALAESKNHHEAEAAMAKAHEFIAKYNIELITSNENRNFISVFVGNPALRHKREEYHLTNLLSDYYFVHAIWVSAYVLDKGKMGRSLELSGTKQNIKIATYIYDFIRHYIDSNWHQYNKHKGLNRYRKTDFAIGIIEGFRSKLKLQNKVKNKDKDSLELIKVEDPLLKKYVEYKYPHTTSFWRNISSQDANVLKDGERFGRKLVIYKGISEKGASKRLLLCHSRSLDGRHISFT